MLIGLAPFASTTKVLTEARPNQLEVILVDTVSQCTSSQRQIDASVLDHLRREVGTSLMDPGPGFLPFI